MLSFLKDINLELHSRARLINRVFCYPVLLTEVQAFVHTSFKWLARQNNLLMLFIGWQNFGNEPSLEKMLINKGFTSFLDTNGIGFDYAGFTSMNSSANLHKHKEFQIVDFEVTYLIYTFLFNYSANLYSFIKKTKPKEELISKKKFLHYYNTLKNYSPYQYEKNMREYESQKLEIERLNNLIKEQEKQLKKHNYLANIGLQSALNSIKNSSISTKYIDKIKNKK
jgi:hypothetical protein